MNDLRQDLIRSVSELMGFPALIPEPEVLAADLAHIRCKSLASLLVKLLTENEPLLMADVEGATVRVRDFDGNVMRFEVTHV